MPDLKNGCGITDNRPDPSNASPPNSSFANKEKLRGKRENIHAQHEDLPQKVFVARESVLTELLESSHYQSFCHLIVAVLLMLSVGSFVTYWFDGWDSLRIDTVIWAFGRLPDLFMIWLSMHLAAIGVLYPGFYYWSNHRTVGNKVTSYDLIWACLYVFYLFGMWLRPLIKVFETEMPPASTIIVVSEKIRLIMKSHAFVRENLRKSFTSKMNMTEVDGEAEVVPVKTSNATDDDDLSQPCPRLSRFLYFLFAPTLVYRDVYPRTSHVRWSYVVSNFAQFFGCFMTFYHSFAGFFWPEFEAFRAEQLTLGSFFVRSFRCMFPGSFIMFATFGILHSWHNAFAELLCFADRLFYKDWWNCTSFSVYYRAWSLLIHDWLYAYVYCDAYKLFKKNRLAAATAVFLFSAVVHEYLISVVFRFFVPLLFVLFFGAGFPLTIFRGVSRLWNVFIWCSLFYGMGVLSCMYCMEWYARRNCPLQADTDSFWLELFPRIFNCG